MTIGESMRSWRIRRKMAIGELAEAAGMHYTTVWVYETDRGLPGLYNLIALADALDVSLDEYVGRIRKG